MLEAAKVTSGEVKRSAIIEMFAEESDVLRVQPFTDVAGGSYTYTQEGTLPTVGFRNVGGSWTANQGTLAPFTEQLKIMGGEIDVDTATVKMHGPEVRAVHERMKIKRMSSNYNLKFIKGDSTTTASEFDGLQVRSLGNQLIAAGATSGGDALSLAKLDQLIDAVDEPTHLLVSKAVARLLTAAARTTTVGGFISYSQDEFGRRVTQYNGLPLLIADRNDYADAVLGFDEANPGGGSAVGTSIYCLSFGEGMLTGLQNGIMEVTDLGQTDAAPVFRTRIEWLCAIAPVHARSFARLWGIKDAAVVA